MLQQRLRDRKIDGTNITQMLSSIMIWTHTRSMLDVLVKSSRCTSKFGQQIRESTTITVDEDKVCYQYVRHQEAGSLKKGWQNGWQCDCDRDTGKLLPERQIDDPAAPGGKRGFRLDDFANHATAKKCKLTKPKVLALRFYTTAGFRSINDPLRDMDRQAKHEAHPLPIMVWLLSNAVKKLWSDSADVPPVNSYFDLYRGMGNVSLENEFLKKGGTELSPMSTTEDLTIAIKYAATGKHSVLLRVRTEGFMNLGAQLKWVSAFPYEVEFLYPPVQRPFSSR